MPRLRGFSALVLAFHVIGRSAVVTHSVPLGYLFFLPG